MTKKLLEHNGKKYNITELEQKIADIGIKTLGFSGLIYYEDILNFTGFLLKKNREQNIKKAKRSVKSG